MLSLIDVLLHILLSEPPPSTRPSRLRIPSLWGTHPCHSARSDITAPSSGFCLCRMYVSLSLTPRRRNVLDLIIASDSQALTKPHISKNPRFSLSLSSESRSCCATTAYVPGITSAEYTIGLKELQCYRQSLMYLSFLSISSVDRDNLDI